MKIVSFLAGVVAGLTIAGFVYYMGMMVGIPSGPGWAVVAVPFVLGMGYLAAISD